MADSDYGDDAIEYIPLWQDCGLCGSVMVAGDKFVASEFDPS